MNADEANEMHCPICGAGVIRTIVTNRDIESDCANEYGAHVGSKYYKFRNPRGAWETDYTDTLSNSPSKGLKEASGPM